MDKLAYMFQNMGPWGWALVASGVLGLAGVVLPVVFRGSGKRPPLALWLAGPTVVLLVGFAGSLSGRAMVDGAIEHAAADMRMSLLAAGLAQVLTVTMFAAGIAGTLSLMAAMGLGIAALARPGEQARTTRLSVGVVAGVGLLTTGGLTAWTVLSYVGLAGFSIASAAFFGTVALALVSARASTAPDAPAAADRATVGTLVIVALVCNGVMSESLGLIEAFEAMASVSSDVHELLIAAEQEAAIGRYMGLAGAGAAVVMTAAASMSVASDIGSAVRSRGVRIVAGCAVLVLSAGALVGSLVAMPDLAQLSRPVEMEPTPAVDLPKAPPDN